MDNIESILKLYQSGDFEQRLSLFLSHRSLRDRFTQIDASQQQAGAECGAHRWQAKKTVGWMQRLRRCWTGA